MNDRITLDMNAGEAILALAAIHEREAAAYAAWRKLMATEAPADEQAAALAAGQILSRLSARLSAALYPECSWLEECEALGTEEWPNGRRYCRRHAAQLRGQLSVFAA